MSTRRTLRILSLAILFGLAVQEPAFSQQDQRTAEIETFIAFAQAVPAEFSADLLIQLVESGTIKDTKRKQELLVDAFYAAAKTKRPVKTVPIIGGFVDERTGYRLIVPETGFDGLSLQCRAIRA